MPAIPMTMMLETSDNFCVLRRQQRGSDTRSWPALHGQVALFSYLSHFMVLVFSEKISGAFLCLESSRKPVQADCAGEYLERPLPRVPL